MQIDIGVISFGGVGSTYLIDYLRGHSGKILNASWDHDGIKHLSYRNQGPITRCKKVIYVFSDPLISIQSLYRRNFHRILWRKLGNPEKMRRWDLRNQNAYFDLVRRTGKDMFGINNQFNLIKNFNHVPIFFVNFYDILKFKKELSEFLEVDESIFDEFQIKERNIKSKEHINPEATEVYQKLYQEMLELNGTILNHTVPNMVSANQINNTTKITADTL